MTPRGILPAFAEGRRNARGDFGDLDIILQHGTGTSGATISQAI